jgi:hypothetical protein
MTNENRPVHLAEHQASPKPVACRACGTWICDDCSARRPYASRFASDPQCCATCASTAGRMAPVVHRESRADDHDAAYRRSVTTRCRCGIRCPTR